MRSLPRRTTKPKALKERNQNRLRLSTPLGIDISVNEKQSLLFIFRLWVYLKRVILEKCPAYKFDIYVYCYYHWVHTSAGGLLVPEGIIRPIVTVSTLTLFIKYICYRNFQFQKLRFSLRHW